MNRDWTGELRDRQDNLLILLRTTDKGDKLTIWRTMEHLDWAWDSPVNIEDRTPTDQTNPVRIWVATFDDYSQLLLEWWLTDDELHVSYRDMEGDTWERPIRLTDTNVNSPA